MTPATDAAGLIAVVKTAWSRWDVLIRPTHDPAAEPLYAAEPAVRRQAVLLLLNDVTGQSDCTWIRWTATVAGLLRLQIPFTAADVEEIFRRLAGFDLHPWRIPWKQFIRVAEKMAATGPLSGRTVESLKTCHTKISRSFGHNAHEKELARITALIEGKTPGQDEASAPQPTLECTDAVGHLATREMAPGGQASGPAWRALVDHALSLRSASVSKQWRMSAVELVRTVGLDVFASVVQRWFEAIDQPEATTRTTRWGLLPMTAPNSSSVDLLKGLAWAWQSADPGSEAGATAIGDLGVRCFTKLHGFGNRSPRLGNACALVLAEMRGPTAIGQLARLKMLVKTKPARQAIEKAMGRVSQRTGASADDLIEMSVPTHSLDANGMLERNCGDFTGTLSINSRSAELRWTDGAGKVLKSAPSAVKREFAPELKWLRKTAKELTTTLSTTAARLEKLLANDRSWPVAIWRERFIDHPVVGSMGRRLIWLVGNQPVAWFESRWVDADDQPVTLPADSAVRLWHPMVDPPDPVLGWRNWLERHKLTQPFKQAHREIYLLTDAERTTVAYSNRFAAHILRQHQMSALCAHRGWVYRLQGGFDGANVPTLAIPAAGLTAEFFVEGIPEQSASGIYPHVSTDQVRFSRPGRGVIPLTEVPPLVFSEVMRDVDLFVGVASVGNDPTWQDGGPEGRYRAYWQNYSFGELSATAATRRDVLARLVPRLKIAGRCSLTERFLVVRGSLRTYKIHLGSGNILMEPNDQYLCIVPDRGGKAGGGELFLPFEGDGTLSVILSKAFLLAADDKITDPTITRQIKP